MKQIKVSDPSQLTKTNTTTRRRQGLRTTTGWADSDKAVVVAAASACTKADEKLLEISLSGAHLQGNWIE